ncbi:MAG: phosphoribosylanthranilate isomerase [Acidobacteria bacterium]|nr:phosphoribosylanthranilate isomerase [Acidobacteriota bacterium]
MSSRPRVKVCGITTPEDALLALELGADFLGLNFYPGSVRCLDTERAETIRAAVGPQARLIGVFVNRPAVEVRALADRLDLELLQFHGDETPAQVAAFGERAIRAFRVDADFDFGELRQYSQCWGFLFDAYDERLLGGSGRTWDHRRMRSQAIAKPCFVAGGLRPDNIAAIAGALEDSGLDVGYDVCSGIESAPGKKDPDLMRQFFEEIRDAETATTS